MKRLGNGTLKPNRGVTLTDDIHVNGTINVGAINISGNEIHEVINGVSFVTDADTSNTLIYNGLTCFKAYGSSFSVNYTSEAGIGSLELSDDTGAVFYKGEKGQGLVLDSLKANGKLKLQVVEVHGNYVLFNAENTPTTPSLINMKVTDINNPSTSQTIKIYVKKPEATNTSVYTATKTDERINELMPKLQPAVSGNYDEVMAQVRAAPNSLTIAQIEHETKPGIFKTQALTGESFTNSTIPYQKVGDELVWANPGVLYALNPSTHTVRSRTVEHMRAFAHYKGENYVLIDNQPTTNAYIGKITGDIMNGEIVKVETTGSTDNYLSLYPFNDLLLANKLYSSFILWLQVSSDAVTFEAKEQINPDVNTSFKDSSTLNFYFIIGDSFVTFGACKHEPTPDSKTYGFVPYIFKGPTDLSTAETVKLYEEVEGAPPKTPETGTTSILFIDGTDKMFYSYTNASGTIDYAVLKNDFSRQVLGQANHTVAIFKSGTHYVLLKDSEWFVSTDGLTFNEQVQGPAVPDGVSGQLFAQSLDDGFTLFNDSRMPLLKYEKADDILSGLYFFINDKDGEVSTYSITSTTFTLPANILSHESPDPSPPQSRSIATNESLMTNVREKIDSITSRFSSFEI